MQDVVLIMEIVWFIVLILCVTFLVWLSIRLMEGKSNDEKSRVFKSFVIAIIGTLIAIGVNAAFGAIPVVSGFIMGAAPYLIYIFWLLLCHGIFDASWKDSIVVSFISLLFIVIFVSILAEVGVTTMIFAQLRA